MPAIFEQRDIRFEYPDNWSVEESSDTQTEQVVVSSPHSAFWQLSKQPAHTAMEGCFDEALAALRSEYHDMEVEPAHDSIEGHELVGFDVNFICLDLTNTCWLRGFQFADSTYLLLCQAEDSEFEQISPVFRAMLASMLRHLRS